MTKSLTVLLLMLLLLAVASPIGLAQEAITADSTTEVDFPAGMTFSLTAQSTSDIEDVFLRYRIERLSDVRVTAVIQPDFSPAPRVTARWTWEMKKMLQSLPPGTRIHYSWRIVDVSGNELETSWETTEFRDDHHSWDSLAADGLTLFWYRGGQSFAQTMLDAADEALQRLSRDTGAYLEQGIRVYIYGSSEDLLNAMIYPQEWMGGAAFPQYGIVAIGIEPTNVAWGKRVMAHEVAHLATHQMTANPYNDIPTWLEEGLSMYAEGDLAFDFQDALGEAVASDDLISVQTLSSNFPSDYYQALLSYAESYSLVDFLISQYDKERMLRLLTAFQQGTTYDDALVQVYGFTTEELSQLWRQSLGLPPRP